MIDFSNAMAKKDSSIAQTKDPLIIWSAYVLVMLLILVVTLYKHFSVGLSADTSYFSMVIAGTFLCAFVYSFVMAYKLRREWKSINSLDDTIRNPRPPNSSAERLAFSIVNHGRPETIKIKDLVDSYYSAQEVPFRTLSVIAGLMVTLGLIGTILGLIISVSGLETVMTQVGTPGGSKGIFGGIKETIQGMAIAFYATLFGAVLGAVVLRMLSMSLTNSLTKLSCGLFEYLELMPKSVEERASQRIGDVAAPLREVSEQFSALTAAMADTTVELKTFVSELAAATAGANGELKKFTSTMLESRLAGISAQLEMCVAALKDFGK